MVESLQAASSDEIVTSIGLLYLVTMYSFFSLIQPVTLSIASTSYVPDSVTSIGFTPLSKLVQAKVMLLFPYISLAVNVEFPPSQNAISPVICTIGSGLAIIVTIESALQVLPSP